MHIHDINIVADLNEHDPNAPTAPPPTQDPPASTPETGIESDGTVNGCVDDVNPETEQAVDGMLTDSTDSITAYWTGWWPECHIEVHKTIDTDVSIDIHSKVDLLGSSSIEVVDYSFHGYEAMSAQDAGAIVTEVVDESSNILDDALWALKWTCTFYWIGLQIFAAVATPATEGAFWAALGGFAVLMTAYLGLTLHKLLTSNAPNWQIGLESLFTTLLLLWRGTKSNSITSAIVEKCPLTKKAGQMFGELWGLSAFRDKWKAVQARTHYGLYILNIVLYVASFTIAAAIFAGVFN